ncbi:LysE family transporter [Paenibacillus illinoisensis]|uniref:LysE family transporter n=1 Tax=Paenibacillus illinoisensis TaxID=59845 RepID=UPI001C8F12D6|nr:LysE family transporter [Paenibacillus illinoisensis]MBY0215018.1 LysE family transporter [Paenibacillus illinoisensis]
MILGYILLGISLSAPIGPINAAQLDKGVRGGFLPSWFVGLGAIAADIIYMLLVYFGIIHLLDLPFVKAFLWLFGFFVLVYTGVESIKNAGTLSQSNMRGDEAALSKSFMNGFLMSLFNPLSIMFWLGIYGSILAKAVNDSTVEQTLINSGAVILGILIWDIFMATAASLFRKYLTLGVLKGISIISGLSLVGFGCYFGAKAVQFLFFI